MKLYELPKDTWFTLEGDRYQFKKIDGMYSQCLDEDGGLRYLAAYADVKEIKSDS